MSQGKREGWNRFFACRQISKVSSNWYFYFRCVWQGMSRLPEITSLLFLWNILRKNGMMKLIFCMQISLKGSYKLILWFLRVMLKHSQNSQSSNFKMSLQYLKKEVRDEFDFCLQISVKVSYKIILTLWASKFLTVWCYHYW